MLRVNVLICCVALALAAFGAHSFAQGYNLTDPIPADHMAKIDAALPPKPRVAPEKPRRLLVYTWPNAYHDAVPYGGYTLKKMGEKSGAFEAVLTSDTAMLSADNLRQFDGLFMNNITPVNLMPKELFLPNAGEGLDQLSAEEQAKAKAHDAEMKQGLLDWLRAGHGIAGNHSSTDCFYQWQEYAEIIGGYFDRHPWSEEVTVKVDDPDNPVAAAFAGSPTFKVTDEMYQFRDTYSRDTLRVLTSMQLTPEQASRPGVNRKDNDFGVSWIRNYGDGRAFFCSLGHRPEIFWNPVVMQHYLDGIQFILGDLKADATPSNQAKK